MKNLLSNINKPFERSAHHKAESWSWVIIAAASCAAIWIWALSGCSGTALTVAPQPVVAKQIAFSGNEQTSGIIDCDKAGCQVDANWVSRYKALEATFKSTIADDTNIKPEGDHYRITYEILEHDLDMKASERGP